MRAARERGWEWSPALLAHLANWGIPWRVVFPCALRAECGTSPDSVFWTGDHFVMAADAAEWTLWHDLGHWHTCRVETPDLLVLKNFGFEDSENLVHCEEDASDVGVALMIRARAPWHQAALNMNYQYTDAWPRDAKHVGLYAQAASGNTWRHVADYIMGEAAKIVPDLFG